MEFDELLAKYNLPLDVLLDEARQARQEGHGFCALINAKNGCCSEDCKYCAQSSYNEADILTHPLVSVDEVTKVALGAKKRGVTHFAIVASGKGPADGDLDKLCEMIETINSLGLKSCASLGILDANQVQKLRAAGLVRYHHNINTAKSYYPEINTTHAFKDRLNTCKLIQKEGLELCCGVILGMGETVEQRVEMALELKKINPNSIPVNILMPIKGTPFENYEDKIDEEHALRAMAIFKIACPNSIVRLAGGRVQRLSARVQELAFKNCVEGAIIGDMLTTIGDYLCTITSKAN